MQVSKPLLYREYEKLDYTKWDSLEPAQVYEQIKKWHNERVKRRIKEAIRNLIDEGDMEWIWMEGYDLPDILGLLYTYQLEKIGEGEPVAVRLAAWDYILDGIGYDEEFVHYAVADVMLWAHPELLNEKPQKGYKPPRIGRFTYGYYEDLERMENPAYHVGVLLAQKWKKVKNEWEKARQKHNLESSPFKEMVKRYKEYMRITDRPYVDNETAAALLSSIVDDLSTYVDTPADLREVGAAVIWLAMNGMSIPVLKGILDHS